MCKDFGKAANLMFGIVNPSYFDMQSYYNYDITKLKSSARFLQVTINRNGISNGICPLLFLGKVASFKELPLPIDSKSIEQVYNYINSLKNNSITSTPTLFAWSKKINNKFERKNFLKYICRLFRSLITKE